MKKLQCEICGGQLMMKDGVAACQSCGMQFSKEEVKKMVVELSGPIKIGGEVKVSGVDDADVFYRRAQGFERLGEFSQAGGVYEDMLKKYPLDGRARLGCCMAEWHRAQAGAYAKGLSDSWWKERVHTAGWVADMEKRFEQAISLLTHPKLISDANVKKEAFRSWVKEAQAQRKDEKQRAAAEKDRAEQERLQKIEAEKAGWLEQEHLWAKRNAEFLNQFTALAIEQRFSASLWSQIAKDVNAQHGKAVIHATFHEFKHLTFTYAFGNEVRGTCIYQPDTPIKKHRKPYQTTFACKVGFGAGHVEIPGDIRPSMDGRTQLVRTLFGKREVPYSYQNDPDKDQ